MNHFVMLIVLSFGIAVVFTLVNKETREERIRYFFTLLLYMVVGSMIGGWVMSFFP